MQVSVDVNSFMCLTSLSIYSDPWKSFMKFGFKKSHEMISYMLVWIITETYFGNQETCFTFHVFMQHTNATYATHLGHMWNNLVKQV
jgi:hypothetical protein